MPRRIDTSGRTINRPELEDDDNDTIVMSVREWKTIQERIKKSNQNPLVSQPSISVAGDNTDGGESPKKQAQAQEAVQGDKRI